MDLYSLKMDEENVILLLSSLPRSYRPLVQMMLAGKPTLKLDDVAALLHENERLMGNVNSSNEGNALAVEISN
ncbi:UBN2_2 domain-containing protein [Cephalotus follicularis]|uniref:UBN2_2 domain-containing protein n=1 Tax=Cephalotus follicularis TaxID=3775 RepID=A0A1Q3B4H6_CEPFO|nr:UBN2_2 domain-containing protein [Cephalotus follicularis]